MNSELCAKLTTPMRPKISVSPVATRTRFTPTVRPISTCVSTASKDMRLALRLRGRRSELARPVVRVRHVLQDVDHDAAHGIGLHLTHVQVLDGGVRLRVEAEHAARAVE